MTLVLRTVTLVPRLQLLGQDSDVGPQDSDVGPQVTACGAGQ